MPALEDQIVKYTVSGVSHPGKVRSINQDNFYCEGCYRGLEHEELGVEGKVRDGSYILISGGFGDKWYKIYTQKGTMRGYISANKVTQMESPAF